MISVQKALVPIRTNNAMIGLHSNLKFVFLEKCVVN